MTLHKKRRPRKLETQSLRGRQSLIYKMLSIVNSVLYDRVGHSTNTRIRHLLNKIILIVVTIACNTILTIELIIVDILDKQALVVVLQANL